jgi:Methyltransferase domain
MQKSTMINLLGRKYGLTRYLEVCVPSTGWQYAAIDRRQFTTCTRLVYRWTPDFEDGSPIDRAVTGEATEAPMLEWDREGARWDAIFVDPWHSYECSLRDLRLALPLLDEGGILVVHDCMPPNREMARGAPRDGAWCGLTYAAFIDFMLWNPELDYYTVDSDYGCAVARRAPRSDPTRRPARPAPELVRLWNALGANAEDRYRFFDGHRAALLNLVSVDEFLAREGLRLPAETQPA